MTGVIAMQFAGWLVVILVASLLPSQAPAADIPTERDVTFFVMSDPHIGFQDKNQPTRSTDEIIGDGRRQVERIAGIIGTPYPDRGPLASLKPGNVATPRALLIAGDLTDNQRWDAFTAVFPPAGIKTATGSIPIPPPDPRTYDVFSCGSLCWVFRVTGDRFVAAHYGGHGTGWDTELVMVKPLTSREISVNDGRPSCTPQKSTAAELQSCSNSFRDNELRKSERFLGGSCPKSETRIE
jgi:hypothetical protein